MSGYRPVGEMTTLTSFTCPQCGRTSHNENDAREGYCGHCHDWTGVPDPSTIEVMRCPHYKAPCRSEPCLRDGCLKRRLKQ